MSRNSKDIAEKHLESFNDVFSDIINVLVFDGENVIPEDELEDINTNSMLAEDNEVREQQRDVSKKWKRNNIIISILGLENQTEIDKKMPLRVMVYDGSSYKYMLANEIEPCPVITLVLNFSNKRWDKYTSLYDCFELDDKIRPFVSNYNINVVDIAFLPRETINKFKSDFKIVADYFVQVRETKKYIPMNDKVKHIWELLVLMRVLTDDERFEDKYYKEHRKEGVTMCEVLDKMIAEGKAEGKAEGIAEGITKGKKEGKNEEKMTIIKRLIGRYPNEEIAYISGLSVSEIEDIIRKIAPSV